MIYERKRATRASAALFGLICLACWGGHKKKSSFVSEKLDVFPTVEPTPTPTPSPAVSLACGLDHVLYHHEGKVYSWGRNKHGNLGDGTTNDKATPEAIQFSEPVRQLVAGYGRSRVVTYADQVWAFGSILWGTPDPVLAGWEPQWGRMA